MNDPHADTPRESGRRKQRRWLLLHVLIGLGVVTVVQLAGTTLARDAAEIGAPELKAELVAARPDAVLLGNSMFKDGVNVDLLDELLRGSDAPLAATDARDGATPITFKHALGGVSTAYWALYTRNCVVPAKPKLLIIPFRDPILTFATFRTAGSYADNIARVSRPEEPDYAEVIARNTSGALDVGDRVLNEMRRVSPAYAARDEMREDLFDFLKALPAEVAHGALPTYAAAVPGVLPSRAAAGAEAAGGAAADAGNPFGALDGTPVSATLSTLDYLHFDRVVDVSFLPMIVQACRENGIRLALLRLHKGPAPDWSDMVPADLLAAYERDCNAWLAANDVILLDTTRDGEFTPDMFRSTDHLNEAGREKLTIRLAQWLARWWGAPDTPTSELERQFVKGQLAPPADAVVSNVREWPVPPLAVEHVRRAMYRVALPEELGADGDTEADTERSRWELLEDGRPLGPAHTALPTIVKFGAGRYAHLGAELLFSASDDSSPRDNGRRYVLRKRVLALASGS